MDHLKGVVYKEPENEGASHRLYLVIYDTVPGGTGSLKELMRSPQNLLHLLELAHQAIVDCVITSYSIHYTKLYDSQFPEDFHFRNKL